MVPSQLMHSARLSYFQFFLFDKNSNELLKRKKISSTFNYGVPMEGERVIAEAQIRAVGHIPR
jgi:hypothetical protein